MELRNARTEDWLNDLYGGRKNNAALPAGQAPVLTYSYDANGLYRTGVNRSGDKNGDGIDDAADSRSLVYDTLGRLTSGIDADWQTQSFSYDVLDRPISGTDAVGAQRSFAYDVNGNLIENKLQVGATVYDKTVYGYDPSDRRELTTAQGNGSGNATAATVFDAAGNATKITGPDGFAINFDYDAVNRVVRAFDQAGNSVFTYRDVDGRPKCAKDPNGNVVFYT